MSRTIAPLVLFLAILVAAACDKVPLLAPTESTINLTVSTTTIPATGTAQVIATVIEKAGTPVQNGTMVTFTGSLGSFEPAEASTVNGKAVTTFRANGTSGTARIGAVSGGAKATEIEVKIGSAAVETVSLRADPAAVPVTGGSVDLIAVVTDISGNPLPGSSVVFSSDAGQLSASSAVTDGAGEARTRLTTNRETAVRARAGAKEATLTVRATQVPSTTISVSPTAPLVGLPVTFTVTPSAPAGGNAIRNVTLDPGDGTPPKQLGAISGATTVQHIYLGSGSFRVTVTVTDVTGQTNSSSTEITVQRAIVGVSVTGPATGDAGTSVSFTVAVSNPSNVPITTVRVEFGDNSAATLPGTGGGTSHTYATAGTFTVRATAVDQSGNQYTGTHQITIRPRAAIQVELDAAPTENSNAFICTTAYPKTCTTSMSAFVPPPGGQVGIRVVFTARVTGALVVPAVFEWDFGDFTRETTTSASRDHVYTAPGTYVITVRVTTTDGNVGEQRLTLQILP